MKLAFLLSPALIGAVCLGQTGLTPQQMAALPNLIRDVRFSPDGTRLALTLNEYPKGVGSNTAHIWEYDLRSRQWTQLTTSAKIQAYPQWSPDGTQVAYLSTSEGRAQLYSVPSMGGDPVRLTDSAGTIATRFAWSPDGKQMAYLFTEAPSVAPAEKTDPTVLFSSAPASPPPSRVYLKLLNLETKQVRDLPVDNCETPEFRWMPGGKEMLVLATEVAGANNGKSHIDIISLETGKATELASPKGDVAKIDVSPDGKAFSFVGMRERGQTPHDLYTTEDLYTRSVAGGPMRNLTGASIDRSVLSYRWLADGSISALVENGFHQALYRVGLDGKAVLSSAVDSPGGFDACNGNTAFVSRQDTNGFEELWLAEGNATPTKVSNFNAERSQLPLVHPEFVHWKSFDGLEIEGELLLPSNYRAGTKAPLVVIAHGGPVARWEAKMEPWGQLLATHGFAVLYPNVRGSTGYGLRFAQMSWNDLGGGDFKDLMAGVDYVIGRGIADPNRLGIAGWSYGGEMSAWAITQTNRFKAAFVGAPVVDWLSEIGTEDDPAGDYIFFGLPWEHLGPYTKQSPLTYMKNAKTPTLIAHGTDDTSNPIGQSHELFQALKHYGVESQLVVYPGEPHGFRQDKHRIDLWTRILAWFESHLNH